MKGLMKKLEKTFAAITFAEADCHDMAHEFLGTEISEEKTNSLETFLENIGLQGVRFSYVVARV
jgi:hypothetical protein